MKIGKTCDAGRDRGGIEPVEYCDRRLLEACDIGRGRLVWRAGVDVISGGNMGWFGLEEGNKDGMKEGLGVAAGEVVAGEDGEGETAAAIVEESKL